MHISSRNNNNTKNNNRGNMGNVRQQKNIMTMYQNQLQQVMKVRLPYYGTNKCKTTELSNSKLDIKIHNNKKGTGMLIDVAISGDRNVIKREAEKILKYKDLII
jgi:hypothetical protein